MKIARIYDDNGQSRFTDIDISLDPPRRQLVVMLSGEAEVETSDGETRRFRVLFGQRRSGRTKPTSGPM